MLGGLMTVIGVVIIGFVFLWVSGIRILKEYERGVILMLGRYWKIKGPGLIWVVPVLQSMRIVDTRIVTMDVEPQDVVTKDNVSVKVNAVVYFKVVDPKRATLDVQNFLFATSQIAQTSLRSILGQKEVDILLSNRDDVNSELQKIIDQHTEPWGVKVTAVEVKNVDFAPEMLRAMARQAEAERERRAKIIHADGEFQASQKLADAARIINTEPATLQLRFLQTLTEIASDKNSTIIFPVPIDLINSLVRK
ncbi:MAG: slipin family protein [Elusimicrobia bacterium]|nr:slipin family protein [Elusimicrobiota bacterium]MBI3012969.1 slipin family protein [Elusimicrobiota bacterium]